MHKRKKRKTHNISNKPSSIIINIVIGVVAAIILVFFIDMYLTNEELKEQEKQNKLVLQKDVKLKQQKIEDQKLHEQQAKYFEEKTKAMEIEYSEENDIIDDVSKYIKQEKNKEFKFITEEKPQEQQIITISEDDKVKEEIQVITKDDEVKPTNLPKQEIILTPKIIKDLPIQTIPKKTRLTPKIVIIIDDVTTLSQVKRIKAIPYPVTMSLLPPIPRHMNSAKIAKNLDFYMIHLPLEAKTRTFEEDNTLHVGDDISIIDKRIEELKKLYPKAKYINNHTGSKFTANDDSMDKLLQILKKYNYIFVDSRTTAKTVTKKYALKYDIRYLSRNIFLDNKQNKKYIQKQLQKAVRIAKRDGFSIAIGHPHRITLKTLAQSKHLLKGLEVILINKL